jgi:hypothetical protein
MGKRTCKARCFFDLRLSCGLGRSSCRLCCALTLLEVDSHYEWKGQIGRSLQVLVMISPHAAKTPVCLGPVLPSLLPVVEGSFTQPARIPLVLG